MLSGRYPGEALTSSDYRKIGLARDVRVELHSADVVVERADGGIDSGIEEQLGGADLPHRGDIGLDLIGSAAEGTTVVAKRRVSQLHVRAYDQLELGGIPPHLPGRLLDPLEHLGNACGRNRDRIPSVRFASDTLERRRRERGHVDRRVGLCEPPCAESS